MSRSFLVSLRGVEIWVLQGAEGLWDVVAEAGRENPGVKYGPWKGRFELGLGLFRWAEAERNRMAKAQHPPLDLIIEGWIYKCGGEFQLWPLTSGK